MYELSGFRSWKSGSALHAAQTHGISFGIILFFRLFDAARAIDGGDEGGDCLEKSEGAREGDVQDVADSEEKLALSLDICRE